MIDVVAGKTAEGWVLQTTDEYKDVLAGPFATEAELRPVAEELELKILEQPKPTKQRTKILRVGALKPDTLFRIGTSWYRMLSHIPGSTKATVSVVGESRNDDLPISTEVTQISVLSLR